MPPPPPPPPEGGVGSVSGGVTGIGSIPFSSISIIVTSFTESFLDCILNLFMGLKSPLTNVNKDSFNIDSSVRLKVVLPNVLVCSAISFPFKYAFANTGSLF